MVANPDYPRELSDSEIRARAKREAREAGLYYLEISRQINSTRIHGPGLIFDDTTGTYKHRCVCSGGQAF